MIIQYIECDHISSIRWALSIIDLHELYIQSYDGEPTNKLYRYSGNLVIIDNPEIYKPKKITIAKHEAKYIGACIYLQNQMIHGCNISTFVNHEYRRKGIGSKLIALTADINFIINYQHPTGFPKLKEVVQC